MKKKIIILLSTIMIVFLSLSNVYALEITKAGDTVVQEGEYDSIRLVAGNKVTNKAKVDGLSFIAGNDLTLEGNVSYGLYAGNNISVNETIEKDLFVAGNNIIIESGSNIGRDVYIAGNKVKIKANLPRDLRMGSSTVDLSGITIGGNAYIASDTIILDENTIITGKLVYPEEAKISNLEKASIGSIEITKNKEIVVKDSFKDSIYDFIISYCAALVTMIVLFYFIPKLKDKLNKLELNIEPIAKTTAIGVLVLILVPILLLIAIFSGILTPLSLMISALYIACIYVSSLLVGYIIGNVITSKYLKKESTFLSLVCGILIIKLIKLIPIIGNIVSAITLLYGLGIIYNLIKPKK